MPERDISYLCMWVSCGWTAWKYCSRRAAAAVAQIDRQMPKIGRQIPKIDRQMPKIDRQMPNIDRQMPKIDRQHNIT